MLIKKEDYIYLKNNLLEELEIAKSENNDDLINHLNYQLELLKNDGLY